MPCFLISQSSIQTSSGNQNDDEKCKRFFTCFILLLFREDVYIPSHLDKQTRNNYLRIFTESESKGTKVNSIHENTHLYERKANNRKRMCTYEIAGFHLTFIVKTFHKWNDGKCGELCT